MPIRRPRPAIIVQTVAAMSALVVLPMWPPASGKLMLVPIAGGDANDMARIAIAGGAALVGDGPLPGSLVIAGNRAAVTGHVPAFAALVIAAPAIACGAASQAGRRR